MAYNVVGRTLNLTLSINHVFTAFKLLLLHRIMLLNVSDDQPPHCEFSDRCLVYRLGPFVHCLHVT